MADAPEPAEFVEGWSFRCGQRRKGSATRLRTGTMHRTEAARKAAILRGLPAYIEGTPLGCGCNIAHLNTVGKIADNGQVEADYTCYSKWHNYVVFQLKDFKKGSQHAVKIDKFGNLTTDTGYQTGELEEF